MIGVLGGAVVVAIAVLLLAVVEVMVLCVVVRVTVTGDVPTVEGFSVETTQERKRDARTVKTDEDLTDAANVDKDNNLYARQTTQRDTQSNDFNIK